MIEETQTITLKELEQMKNKLHYLEKCTANERRVFLQAIESVGEKQYFNAFRRIAELVTLCTYNLQSLINKEETK